jgi:hypothetical protein
LGSMSIASTSEAAPKPSRKLRKRSGANMFI